LRRTDVPEHVVEVLAASRIEEVQVVARRGPAHAKYTNKELLELGALGHTSIVVAGSEMELDEAQQAIADSDAMCARRLRILRGFVAGLPPAPGRRIRLRFNLTPNEITGDHGRLQGVRFATPGGQELVAAGTVFRSIGYQSAPIPGLPFDDASCTVPNVHGR